MKKVAVFCLLAIGLVGCASVPMETSRNDATAKLFNKPTDMAGLYIYRNEYFGAAIKMDLEIDGSPIGRTVAKTYFYKEVPPGKHTIVSKAENVSSLEIDAEAGMLYYIWQEVKMGFLYARSQLHLVGEEEGQKGVNESNLAVIR